MALTEDTVHAAINCFAMGVESDLRSLEIVIHSAIKQEDRSRDYGLGSTVEGPWVVDLCCPSKTS